MTDIDQARRNTAGANELPETGIAINIPFEGRENLKRYALLVWRIHKRREREAIDRNPTNR